MSELRAATISNLAGTGPVELTGQAAAKSWVNFDGTDTVSIRESFNVSSITDNGTGDYTVNFASALVDANYVALITTVARSLTSTQTHGVILGDQTTGANNKTASEVSIQTGSTGNSNIVDVAEINVAIIR